MSKTKIVLMCTKIVSYHCQKTPKVPVESVLNFV